MIEKRLGRGLESLISRTQPATPEVLGQELVVEIPTDSVVPNPDQPRQVMSQASLEGLAQSIRRHGVLQPIIVQRLAHGYQLVAGERRLQASRLAERSTVRALIVDVDADQSLELALIENIQRENLSALEEAAAYEAIIARRGMTHQELADTVGKARTTVTNTLRLLDLPDGVKLLVDSGALSAGQARALLGAADAEQMEALASMAAKSGWSVREVERRVRDAGSAVKAPSRGQPKARSEPINASDIEEKLRRLYGTRVTVKSSNDKGEIRFEFYSGADRDRLLHSLLKGPEAADQH